MKLSRHFNCLPVMLGCRKVATRMFAEQSWLEVVNGSRRLRRFMAMMEGVLTTNHVSLMWRSVVDTAPALRVSILAEKKEINLNTDQTAVAGVGLPHIADPSCRKGALTPEQQCFSG